MSYHVVITKFYLTIHTYNTNYMIHTHNTNYMIITKFNFTIYSHNTKVTTITTQNNTNRMLDPKSSVMRLKKLRGYGHISITSLHNKEICILLQKQPA